MTRTPKMAIAAALLLLPIPALAGDVPTRIVQYGDLDLTGPEGVTRLERRIAAAARSMCPADDLRNLNALMGTKKCRDAAIASAERQTKVAIADARASQQVASVRSLAAPME